MKLSTRPDRRAADDPHGPAVADTRQRLTNAALRDHVHAVAHQLCDRESAPVTSWRSKCATASNS